MSLRTEPLIRPLFSCKTIFSLLNDVTSLYRSVTSRVTNFFSQIISMVIFNSLWKNANFYLAQGERNKLGLSIKPAAHRIHIQWSSSNDEEFFISILWLYTIAMCVVLTACRQLIKEFHDNDRN